MPLENQRYLDNGVLRPQYCDLGFGGPVNGLYDGANLGVDTLKGVPWSVENFLHFSTHSQWLIGYLGFIDLI